MKINNICDNEHLEDCGIPNKITPWDNESLINLQDILTLQSFNVSSPHNMNQSKIQKQQLLKSANGESILVYYNPNCQGDLNETGSHSSQPKMCANFVYDLNGKKGPNTVGKDIGSISAIFPVDSLVVAPIPAGRYAKDGSDGNFEIARKRCASLDDDSRLPNKYELAAMFYNKNY